MTDAPRETATIAGGCFWCLEAVYERLRGVDRVVSGYAGGRAPNPSYEQVCTGTTGHAEVVQITFDPTSISYQDLLEIFFSVHDPTTMNRQGNDAGTQYRSAIFVHTPEQERIAHTVVEQLTRDAVFPDPIVTEILSCDGFYPAEAQHQGYYRQNPNHGYCQVVIAPKLAKTRKLYAEKLRD